MRIQLSDHFGYRHLLRFTFPSIIMMVFTSIYGMVDGLFVSNYTGDTAFAAVNFIMPFVMILSTFGFVFGTGGSALVAKTMGEGDYQRAKQLFSMFLCATFILGIIISVLAFLFVRPIAQFLGAEGEMLDIAVRYARLVILGVTFFMFQNEFQSFFITAEKPTFGLIVTIIAGVTNMVLDWLLVGILRMNVEGAALATVASQFIGAVIPLAYFVFSKKSILYITKPIYDLKALLKGCTNGASELMSSVSMSLVNMLYNVQLLKYYGQDGISAFGVLMYVNMIFLAIYIGYSIGSAPVISFHYGAQNTQELKGLLKRSVTIILVASVIMLGFGEIMAEPLSKLFVGYKNELCELTTTAFLIYSFSFLFSGIAIFGSSFFTALNDGLTSALISFLRTLVFQVAAVFVLPLILGPEGIWYSIVFAELIAAITAILFILLKRKKYNYM